MARFSKNAVRRIGRAVNWVEDRILRHPMVPPRRVIFGSSACAANRNEVWAANLYGAPDSGTFDMEVAVNGSRETLASNAYNITAAAFQAALESHTQVTGGDVVCSGGPFPFAPIRIEWQGAYEATDMIDGINDVPIIDSTNLASTLNSGPAGDFTRWVAGWNEPA